MPAPAIERRKEPDTSGRGIRRRQATDERSTENGGYGHKGRPVYIAERIDYVLPLKRILSDLSASIVRQDNVVLVEQWRSISRFVRFGKCNRSRDHIVIIP